MERKAKKNFLIDVFYMAVILFLALFGSYVVLKYLLPFVIGTVLAFAVQKPSQYISQKTAINKGTISAILSVIIYLSIGFVFVFLIYKILKFSVSFADILPQLFQKLGAVLEQIKTKYSSIFTVLPQNFAITVDTVINNTLNSLTSKLGGVISELATGFAKRMPSFFISSIVTLVATCYISKDFEHLRNFAKMFFGKGVAIKIAKLKNILIGSVFKLLKGYLILSLIAFVELYIGFLIIDIDNPFALAFLIALVDLLPVIGTGTVMIPWAVISALIGNLPLALSVAVLYIVTVLVRNFLEPKIIGMQIGINSLFTLIFMFAGFKILGVAGLILFPIIFIVTVRYYRDEMNEGLSV